jgi:hypothetical protein
VTVLQAGGTADGLIVSLAMTADARSELASGLRFLIVSSSNEASAGAMKMHLDFAVSYLEELERQRERAEALGAQLLLDRTADASESLHALADLAGHPLHLRRMMRPLTPTPSQATAPVHCPTRQSVGTHGFTIQGDSAAMAIRPPATKP